MIGVSRFRLHRSGARPRSGHRVRLRHLSRSHVGRRGRDVRDAPPLPGHGASRRSDFDLVPEVATELSGGLARRQDLHVHDPEGLSLQHRRAGDGRELRARDQASAQPGDELTRLPRVPPGRRGVKAAGNQLIVRLTKRVPDFPARMTMPYLCPVPTDLPIDPEGVGGAAARLRPLLRRRVRARQPRRAEAQPLLPRLEAPPPRPARLPDRRRPARRIRDKVEAGERRRRPRRAARRSSTGSRTKYGVNKTQFFSVRSADMFYLFMNTERPLFKNNPKLRQAVNFALDRTAMLRVSARCASARAPTTTCRPGCPGYATCTRTRSGIPNLAKARALASGHTRSGKAVMYACDNVAIRCLAHAQIVQTNLKQIGIDVEIKQFPYAVVRRQDRHPRRAVRPDGRAVRRRLGGSLPVRGHAARRADDPGDREHEPLVLQLASLQQADRPGRTASPAAPATTPTASSPSTSRETPRRWPRSSIATTASSSPAASAACRRRARPRPRRPLRQVAPAPAPSPRLPSPTAIPRGLFPTRIVATTLLVPGRSARRCRRRCSRPRRPRRRTRSPPALVRRDSSRRVGARVDRVTRVVAGVGDPDGAAADGDAARAAADGDRSPNARSWSG